MFLLRFSVFFFFFVCFNDELEDSALGFLFPQKRGILFYCICYQEIEIFSVGENRFRFSSFSVSKMFAPNYGRVGYTENHNTFSLYPFSTLLVLGNPLKRT